MPIAVSCRCGKRFAAPDTYAGKRVKCPGCGEGVSIPSTNGSSAARGKPDKISIKCSCGQVVAVVSELVGKAVKCPSCGGAIRVAIAPPSPSEPSSSRRIGLAAILDEVGAAKEGLHKRCPQCQKDMDADDVLCVGCGYNLETGKQLSTKRIARQNPYAAALAGGGPAKRKELPTAIKSATRSIKVLGVLDLLVGLATAGLWMWMTFAITGAEVVQEVIKVAPLTLGLLALLGIGLAAFSFWVAAGLHAGEKAAWIGGLVFAGLNLFNFPVGTLIGASILLPLISDEARAHCGA
jgi:hypothetical protein